MGVSISQWRSAIGYHSCTSTKPPKQYKSCSSSMKTSGTKIGIFYLITTLLGIFSLLTICIYSTAHLSTIGTASTWPPSTPPTTLQTLWSAFPPAVWLYTSSSPFSPAPWSPSLSTAWPSSNLHNCRLAILSHFYPAPWLCSWTSTFPTTSSSPWSPPWPSGSTPTAAIKSAKSWLTRKKKNKLVRAKTGNRQNRGIKLAHWNAGSAHLTNKMHEIEQVVSENRPHLLGISAANFRRGHDIEEVQLEEYDLILSKTFDNDQLQISKQQSLVGKVREDLMSDQFSSVWVEIGLPGKNKILVCQLYREWRYMGQSDRGEHSKSIGEQMRRWVIFLDQWEMALATGKEVIVLGDYNLDFLKFNSAGVLQPLVDTMLQRIYPHGVIQCVQGPTHSWPGQTPSGIDHIYTNVPEKLSQVQVKVCGSSDHRLILATRYARNIKQNIRYCKNAHIKTLIRKNSYRRLRT